MQTGRKNVHGKGGVRFKTGYTSSKQKGQVRNLVTELVIYEKVTVCTGMVKDVVHQFDRLVTYAKKVIYIVKDSLLVFLKNMMLMM